MRVKIIAALLLAAGALSAAPSSAVSSSAPASMQWEILRNEAGPQGERTKARLSLSMPAGQVLPAQGWSIYFNCMDGIVTGPLNGNLVMESVSGGLFRVRPAPGFQGVAAGRALKVDFYYPNLVIKMARAPSGPYLVFDAQPDEAIAIDDFKQLLPVRPEQLKRSGGKHALVTVQDTYRRNARAEVLPAGVLPPVFPTPVEVRAAGDALHLARMPKVIAAEGLRNEAAFAEALFERYLPHVVTSDAGETAPAHRWQQRRRRGARFAVAAGLDSAA
jgi:hexosaminidase